MNIRTGMPMGNYLHLSQHCPQGQHKPIYYLYKYMNLEAASWNFPKSQTPGLKVLPFTFVTAVCQPWRNSGRFFSFASVSKYFRMFFKEEREKKQHYSPTKEQERDTDCLVGILLTTRTNFRWALGAELESRGKEMKSGGYCAFYHQGSFWSIKGSSNTPQPDCTLLYFTPD